MDDDKRFDALERSLQHLASIQVSSDSINQSRSAAIIVTQGLLAVAAQSVGKDAAHQPRLGLLLVSAFGLLLSLAWLLLEQRNQVYFTSRGNVLEHLEEHVVAEARARQLRYPRFWTAVPHIARQNARWYQRHSAPRVFRVYLPLLFVLGWSAVLLAACVLPAEAPARPTRVQLVR